MMSQSAKIDPNQYRQTALEIIRESLSKLDNSNDKFDLSRFFFKTIVPFTQVAVCRDQTLDTFEKEECFEKCKFLIKNNEEVFASTCSALMPILMYEAECCLGGKIPINRLPAFYSVSTDLRSNAAKDYLFVSSICRCVEIDMIASLCECFNIKILADLLLMDSLFQDVVENISICLYNDYHHYKNLIDSFSEQLFGGIVAKDGDPFAKLVDKCLVWKQQFFKIADHWRGKELEKDHPEQGSF